MNQPDHSRGYPRRRFLGQIGVAGLAAAGSTLITPAARAQAGVASPLSASTTPIQHIIVCCQENHSARLDLHAQRV